MFFSTSLFIFLYLPAFLLLYHALPFRFRSLWILIASWLFYAWWRVDHLALLVATTSVTWLLGRWIASDLGARKNRARSVLAAGVSFNLGILAYFKYTNFGIDSLNALLSTLGADTIPALNVILPIGISFYVFKATSYLIDVYRRDVPAAKSYLELAAYIALFPQLIAGPIDRYRNLAPQFRQRAHTLGYFSAGALRFMSGFCKKVLIADTIAPLADSIFALNRPTFVDAWFGAGAYTMQLYFDFSGYTDMAIGLGLMMGFRFMENFREPYLATSITDFWKRWHISLSSWFRDYLYIPLGGNRQGPRRTYVNLMVVMVLCGLWHGPAWTFVVWGAWHGILLAFERYRSAARQKLAVPQSVAIVGTMLLVMIGWVVFRASSLPDAFRMYAGMLGLHGFGLSSELRWRFDTLAALILGFALVVVYLGPWLSRRVKDRYQRWQRVTAGARLVVLPLFLISILKILADSSQAFLYARF
jgi:alginate O-acetyltransferase complex protein AlgI